LIAGGLLFFNVIFNAPTGQLTGTVAESVLYPTGLLAYNSTEAWYEEVAPPIYTNVFVINMPGNFPPETTASLPTLLLPLLSALVQLMIAWLVISRIYAWRVRRS
jgi:hypothetical protein